MSHDRIDTLIRHAIGGRERADALARDHLVDHPGSLIVAWMASDAIGTTSGDSSS